MLITSGSERVNLCDNFRGTFFSAKKIQRKKFLFLKVTYQFSVIERKA